jgi:hypothetical protein
MGCEKDGSGKRVRLITPHPELTGTHETGWKPAREGLDFRRSAGRGCGAVRATVADQTVSAAGRARCPPPDCRSTDPGSARRAGSSAGRGAGSSGPRAARVTRGVKRRDALVPPGAFDKAAKLSRSRSLERVARGIQCRYGERLVGPAVRGRRGQEPAMAPSLLGFLVRRGVGVQAVHHLCRHQQARRRSRPGRHRLSRPARQLRTLSLAQAAMIRA